ncbi:hypothetical protein BDC45DRAFT_540982 [Circinella umbellata]|nr:hypothetical protein BDC45DRAFT_540982 [Circinella umbellata]
MKTSGRYTKKPKSAQNFTIPKDIQYSTTHLLSSTVSFSLFYLHGISKLGAASHYFILSPFTLPLIPYLNLVTPLKFQHNIEEPFTSNTQDYYSGRQVTLWLAAEKDHFGELVTKRDTESKPRKGRWLYQFKQGVIGPFLEDSNMFRNYCTKQPNSWINIAYIRKSPTPCSQYLSHLSAASKPLMSRDCPVNEVIMNELKGMDGTTQERKKVSKKNRRFFEGVLDFTKHSWISKRYQLVPKVRLCIIDYAEMNENVEEIVVDRGSKIEVLDRFTLVEKGDILSIWGFSRYTVYLYCKFSCKMNDISRSYTGRFTLNSRWEEGLLRMDADRRLI